MPICVVLISDRSLFAKSVASCLPKYLRQVDLQVVDSERPEALDEIIRVRPNLVVLEIAFLESHQPNMLERLLLALPSLKIIGLDTRKQDILLLCSEQLIVSDVRDLASLIETATLVPANASR